MPPRAAPAPARGLTFTDDRACVQQRDVRCGARALHKQRIGGFAFIQQFDPERRIGQITGPDEINRTVEPVSAGTHRADRYPHRGQRSEAGIEFRAIEAELTTQHAALVERAVRQDAQEGERRLGRQTGGRALGHVEGDADRFAKDRRMLAQALRATSDTAVTG